MNVAEVTARIEAKDQGAPLGAPEPDSAPRSDLRHLLSKSLGGATLKSETSGLGFATSTLSLRTS
jgi:hypothetical protein